MILTDANRDLLNALYRMAIELRDLQPWQWMTDADIFGVQDPATGTVGYCCIMGNAGEVYALAVYPGPEGLATYYRLAAAEDEDHLMAYVHQQLLLVSFEDRDELEERDLQEIKALNFRFRGKRQWVMFRDHKPGYAPWFIEEHQARFLLRVLEQAVEVAKRCRDEPGLLEEREELLIRVPEMDGADIHWSDEYRPEPDLPELEPLSPDLKLVEEVLQEYPRLEKTVLFGITAMPGPMRNDPSTLSERPFFGHLALLLDYDTQMIAGQHLFSPEEIRSSFQSWFIREMVDDLGGIPSSLLVPNEYTGNLIVSIADALNIQLYHATEESAFQEIIQYLFKHLKK